MNSGGDKLVTFKSSNDYINYALQLNGSSTWTVDTISSNYHDVNIYFSSIITNNRKLMSLFDVRPVGCCTGIDRELWYGYAEVPGASCTNPTVPTVTGGSMCPSGNVNLTISGTLNNASKWYIYTSGCGSGIHDSTSSGTFNVSPSSTTTYYIRGEGNCVTPGSCGSATVTVNTLSSITSVSAAQSTICNGTQDTLTANGVTVGSGATLTWFTGAGGTGSNLGTGNPLYHTPSGTTTYYARLSGTCNTLEASTNVTVNTLSAIGSVSAAQSTICNGTQDTLTANGVTVGSGATLTWFTGAGGTGSNLGTSNPLHHTPSGTTTYYARLAGTCNTVEASAMVTVNTPSAITSVTVSQGTICEGNEDTLTANGVTVGSGATLTWFTGAGGTGSNLGTGNPLHHTPSGTTTYYARLAGTCNTVEESTSVTVNTNSSITSVTASLGVVCSGEGDTLTANGVIEGTGATLTWFTGAGGTGSNLGTGNPLNHTPTGTTTYYARLDGTCNTVEESATVTVNTLSTITSVTAAQDTICDGGQATLTANGATEGTSATLTWFTGAGGTGSNLGTGNPLNHTPTGTTTYYARLDGTCNAAEESTTVTVNTNSSITSVTASLGVVCYGQGDTLTANGVVTGTGATLTWFTATGGGGTNLGTANPLHHIPLSNTTYYARLSGICNTVEANASVTVNSLPVISSITSSRNPSVNGYAPYQCADLTVTATGAGSLTYDWSNAATGSVINVCPTVGTTYEVMVTDGNGCIETDTFRQKVIEGNSPYAGRIILCYSYPRRAPANIHVYPTQVQQYLNAGATLGACGNLPNKRNFDAFYDDIYRIYPNPAQNQITVEWFNMFNEIVNIDLVDMTGRVVKNIYNGEVLEGNISLTTTDVSNLPAGMYFMRYSSPTDVRINKVQLMR
jgi:hypothetical protein